MGWHYKMAPGIKGGHRGGMRNKRRGVEEAKYGHVALRNG